MTYSNILCLGFAGVLIADILVRINSFIGVSNGSTIVQLVCYAGSISAIIIVVSRVNWRDNMPKLALQLFNIMLAWNIVTLMRGAFNAENYWDWKVLLLTYLPSIVIPLVMLIGLHYSVSYKVLRFIVVRLFLFGFIAIPFALGYDTELYSRIVAPVSVFILFIPYLKIQWKVLVVVVALVSVFMELTYRINVLRIGFPLGLVLVFYFSRILLRKKLLNSFLVAAFLLPLVFLQLGVAGQFNLFEDWLEKQSEFEVSANRGGKMETSAVNADTRTFLYFEVFHSMKKRDSSFLIGEGAATGYETDWFADDVLTRKGRRASEVGFLNILLYSGVIGVFLYAAMLFVAAFYGVNRSNNHLCKMLGVFLAFHWVIFFIEDIPKMDMNFYFIWFAVGLCLSNQFRSLSDRDIRSFFDFVFSSNKLPGLERNSFLPRSGT